MFSSSQYLLVRVQAPSGYSIVSCNQRQIGFLPKSQGRGLSHDWLADMVQAGRVLLPNPARYTGLVLEVIVRRSDFSNKSRRYAGIKSTMIRTCECERNADQTVHLPLSKPMRLSRNQARGRILPCPALGSADVAAKIAEFELLRDSPR